MGKAKLVLAILALTALTACGADAPIRNGSTGLSRDGVVMKPGGGEAVQPDFRVTRIDISVPRTLSVSESNEYHPKADIVWRGDPYGDRYRQIEDIFETAMQRGAAQLRGGRPVAIEVVVMRFHALTERTYYTIGGIHSLTYALTVRDARTGEVIQPTRTIKADLDGLGGEEALAAERAGQTQKVRITAHLAQSLVRELSRPYQR